MLSSRHAPSRAAAPPTAALAAALLCALVAPAAAARAPEHITMDVAAGLIVNYGDELRIAGGAEPAEAGQTVELQYAPPGEPFATVAQSATDGEGRYELAFRPAHNGAIRAVSGTAMSETRPVTVAAALVGEAQAHVRVGRVGGVGGALHPSGPARTVFVDVWAAGAWRVVAAARTLESGRFDAYWRPSAPGVYTLRIRFAGDERNAATTEPVHAPVAVYRRALASWYGPGFFGRLTACGLIVRRRTLGVAHKRLPCGTRVTFFYGGRSITVPVIDRGPYVGRRAYDLTYATKRALGFDGVRYVGATR